MPWAAGVYTRFYAGTGNWDGDRIAGTLITASRHDAHDGDLASGINNCLTKDGQNAATANISLGGFKVTNLGAPTVSTDAATKAYVDSAGSVVFASGDQILFRNAGGTAPTGWSIVAQNNKALRIVSGVPSSGGSTAFTTAFNAPYSTATEGNHTHTLTGVITSASGTSNSATLGATGFIGSHTHTLVGSTDPGSAHSHTVNLAVAYYDMNVIQKT